MREHVINFTQHLKESLQIGESVSFSIPDKEFSNVLISGLGGSGIGGTIVAQLVADVSKIPFHINKDYGIPQFVNDKTLFIACSYSGNTEETIDALSCAEKTGAEIVCITSGGKLLDIAASKGYNHIKIPGGFPPRAAIGYSLCQLYFILGYYNIITKDFISHINAAIKTIDHQEEEIREEARVITDKLFNKIPVIYTVSNFEGVAVRFRQQINENSKMLCWHHVIPEMNHNELVGWAGGSNEYAVIIFRNNSDYTRNQSRIEINKEIISKYTDNITEVYSKGDSNLERALYHIHLGDWVSVFLADKKQIDAVEVNVIDFLKGSLSQK